MRARIALFAGAGLSVLGWSVQAQELVLHGWNVTGETSLTGDYFIINGASNGSAFAFDGAHGVAAVNADFTKPLDGARSLKGDISLSADGSDYFQASDNFVTLERLSLEYADGDAATPWRLQLGDFLGFYSRRTLQRGLKGAQVEFQPERLQSDVMAGSLIFSVGNTAAAYNLIGERNTSFGGGSLLLNHADYGDLAFSVVYGTQAPFDGSGNSQDQTVGSIAASRNLTFDGHQMTLDGEIALLHGDVNDGTLVRDEDSFGAVFGLNGRQSEGGLSYGLRLERFGDGFAPLGGQATADRLFAEASLAYRFEGGYALRAVGSETEESLTANKTFRRSARLNLSGPLPGEWLQGWNGFADIFRTHNRNQNVTTNSVAWTGVANLSGPLAEGYSGSLGLFANDFDDRLANANDSFVWQVTGDVSHRRNIGDYRLTGSAGLSLRVTQAQNDQVEIGPTLRLGISRGAHSLRVNYTRLDSRNDGGNAVDIVTDNFSLNYGWFEGLHRVEARAGYFGRTPDGQEQTDTLFAGLTYTYRFGEPKRRAPAARVLPTLSDSLKLSSLPPGVPARTADVILSALGVKGRLGDNVQLVEATNLYPVQGRQRLVVEQQNGLVNRIGVVVETLGLNADEITRELDRLQDFLSRRYGPPQQQIIEGEVQDFFGAGVDLPVRVTDWRLPTGATLRLGLPPRFGAQPRIEVVAAQDFSGDPRVDWGFADLP